MPRSDHLQGAVHHHKGLGVDAENDIFQLWEFRQCGDGKNHFFWVTRISAFCLQKSGTPVDLLEDLFRNFLVFIRNDGRRQSLVKAREDRIEGFAAREYINQAVKGNLKSEKITACHDHHCI